MKKHSFLPSIPLIPRGLALAVLSLVIPAFAGAADPLGDSFCHYADIFSETGHILSILTLVTFAIGMMFGKTGWGLTLLHVAAAAIFVSAGNILESLGQGGCV